MMSDQNKISGQIKHDDLQYKKLMEIDFSDEKYMNKTILEIQTNMNLFASQIASLQQLEINDVICHLQTIEDNLKQLGTINSLSQANVFTNLIRLIRTKLKQKDELDLHKSPSDEKPNVSLQRQTIFKKHENPYYRRMMEIKYFDKKGMMQIAHEIERSYSQFAAQIASVKQSEVYDALFFLQTIRDTLQEWPNEQNSIMEKFFTKLIEMIKSEFLKRIQSGLSKPTDNRKFYKYFSSSQLNLQIKSNSANLQVAKSQKQLDRKIKVNQSRILKKDPQSSKQDKLQKNKPDRSIHNTSYGLLSTLALQFSSIFKKKINHPTLSDNNQEFNPSQRPCQKSYTSQGEKFSSFIDLREQESSFLLRKQNEKQIKQKKMSNFIKGQNENFKDD